MIRFYKGLTFRMLTVAFGVFEFFITVGVGGLEVNLTMSKEARDAL